MAERQTSVAIAMQTVSQTLFLLYTQLVLKSWNLVLFLPLSILLLFGIQCCHLAFSGWLNARGKGRLVGVTGFAISEIEPSIISTTQLSTKTLTFALNTLKSMDSNFDGNRAYWNCPTRESCASNLYLSMMHSSGNQQKYFIDNDRKAIICPATYSNELHCSFFGSIFVHSRSALGSANWFKNYSTFHLTSDASDINDESTPFNSCVGDRKFFFYLPKLLTFLSVLLLSLVCMYFLLTTVYCITELKGCGFLQLMIRKGLSPSSYWSSVWLWTSTEVLLLSICLTMSFYIQCPGFYSLRRIYIVLLITTTFLFCAVSFMLLMTVLTNDYYTICKCTIAYIIAVGVLAIGNRLAQEASDFVGLKQLRIVLLLIPCGNFAEQLQANFVGQVRPYIENKFHAAGILVNILLIVFTVTVTLYLDYVLPSGNALRYPYFSLFCSSSSSRKLPDISNHRPGIESMNHDEVIVRFAQVSAKPPTNDANPTDAQSGQFSGLLSYYSTKVYRYSLEFFNFINNDSDVSQHSVAVYSEKHVLCCLIAIPVHTVILTALVLLLEPARERFCSNSAAGEERNMSSRNATDGDYVAVASGSSINAVELNHMTKHFDPSSCAVRDVNLGVKPGELLSLIGSTGSGMTTVISTIAGRLTPTSGECRIRCGASGRWLSGRPARLSSAMAVSLYRSPLFKVATIAEHVRLYAGLLGVSSEREAQLLKDFHLGNCKDKTVGQLSPGQKRRLGLIITLMKSSPTVFVADDVSVGVNSPKEMDIWRAIALNRNDKMSVIVSGHDLNGAEAVASSVALINQGKLICIETPGQLRESFGIYILEIDLAAQNSASYEETKVNVLRKIVARFFETTVLDQTVSWMKIALPEQSVQSPMESLNWLLQLRSQLNAITDILFYPASSDQLLEYVFEAHEKHSRKKASISAPPLVELPEFYDV